MIKKVLKINCIVILIVVLIVATYKTSVGIKIAAYLGYDKAQYKLAISADVKKNEEEAFKWYKKAAENNYPPAYFMLGRRYAKGTGTKQNYSEALKWFKKSDESRASYEIGKIYYYGYGMERDYGQAIKYFKEAAERFEHSSNAVYRCNSYVYNRLGKMYYKGLGEKQNFEEAVKYFNKNSGHPESAFYLGKIYYANKVRHNKNPAEIGEYFNKSADFLALDLAMFEETLNGETYKEWLPDWAFNAAEGQLYVGEIAYKAAEETLTAMKKGIKNEYTKQEAYETYSDAAKKRFQIFSDIDCDITTGDEYAEKLSELRDEQIKEAYTTQMKISGLKYNPASKAQACKNLMARSYFDIAVMYYQGIGYEQSYPHAVNYWTKAANYGNANAEFNLGLLYYDGLGISKDQSKGMALIESASQKGVIDATRTLGIIYMRAKNYSKAFYSYEQAAQKGDTDSKVQLGKMYSDGIGVDKDKKKALQWYEEAAKDGNSEAIKKVAYTYLSDKDYNKAKYYFDELWAKGDAAAAYEIGNMYSYGWGVSENDDEAIEWYKKAAKAKNLKAIALLLVLEMRKHGGDYHYMAAHKEEYKELNFDYFFDLVTKEKIDLDVLMTQVYFEYQMNKYGEKRESVYNKCIRNGGDHYFCSGFTDGIIGGW